MLQLNRLAYSLALVVYVCRELIVTSVKRAITLPERQINLIATARIGELRMKDGFFRDDIQHYR